MNLCESVYVSVLPFKGDVPGRSIAYRSPSSSELVRFALALSYQYLSHYQRLSSPMQLGISVPGHLVHSLPTKHF